MKQEYLMLAHTFKSGKHNIGGWYMSEKFDGMRAYWDGGLSRGSLARDVPYANTVKDHRLKKNEVATGLWSRTGKVIHAPDNWLNVLPKMPLDGELWLDRGAFQDLTKIVSRHNPTSDWCYVRFLVFDSPPFLKMLEDRVISVRDYKFKIKDALEFYLKEGGVHIRSAGMGWNFEHIQDWLQRKCPTNNIVILVRQERLPLAHQDALKHIGGEVREILEFGAEGVMLRKPESFWDTRRCHQLLKYKPWKDDEAKIIGFTSGRETDRGSRLLGLIGALIVDYNGKRLELSGLTDEERQFQTGKDVLWAAEHPGKDLPEGAQGDYFKVGQIITFKYRELSDDGVPKEARYWRKT